jgi:hypothetical protein
MTGLVYSRHWPLIARLLVVVTLAGYAGGVLLVAHLFGDIDDPTLRYAVAFIVVQTGILVALVLGLVVSKVVRTKWESVRSARIRRFEDLITQPDTESALLETSRKYPNEFLSVIENSLHLLKGPVRNRLMDLLEASPAYQKVLEAAKARDPRRAIRAITLLGQLDNVTARAAAYKGLDHPSDAVKLAARKAVLMGGEETAKRAVVEGIGKLPLWQRVLMFHLVPADSTLLAGFLSESLRCGDEEKILTAFELVLTQQRLLPIPVPSGLSASPNLEIRIKFFKALPFLYVDDDVRQVLQRGLDDSDWRVRAMAARACGQFRAAMFAPRLFEMCQSFADPSEARHAARALAALGGEAWLQLQRVGNSGTDVARQIATEAVERHMLGGTAEAAT